MGTLGVGTKVKKLKLPNMYKHTLYHTITKGLVPESPTYLYITQCLTCKYEKIYD